MTEHIRVGDRVQWWEPFKHTKHEPRMMTGTVISSGGRYIGIKGDVPPGTQGVPGKKESRLFGGNWVRKPEQLTRISVPALTGADLEANGQEVL